MFHFKWHILVTFTPKNDVKLYILLHINETSDALKYDKWNRSCIEIRHSGTSIKKKIVSIVAI